MENQHHFQEFFWAIVNNWAGYATGGTIAAIVWLWLGWKQRAMPRKWLAYLCLCFLAMAIYKAWEDQYEKVVAATSSNDAALHQTHESLQMINSERMTIDAERRIDDSNNVTIGRFTADLEYLRIRETNTGQNTNQQQSNPNEWLPPELPPGCSNVSVSFGTMRIDEPIWMAKLPHAKQSSNHQGTNSFTTQISPNLKLTFLHFGDTVTNDGAVRFKLTDLPEGFISNAEKMPDFSPRKRTVSFSSDFMKTQLPNGKSIDARVWPLVISNRLFVDVEIPFLNQRHLIFMDTNMDSALTNLPRKWDVNYNSNRFEIVNQDTNPVLQVIYKSPSEVLVNGIYVVSKSGIYAAFDSPPFMVSETFGMQPTQLMEIEDFEKTHPNISIAMDSNALYGMRFSFVKTIFKYPSWAYLGELNN